jgi:MoxR-like ATPase
MYQAAIRKLPVTDAVIEYAVKLAASSRPGSETAAEITNNYLSWGAGPRASQYLIIGAKCHAALNGKYSPDIEDVKALALPIFRHRLVRNYKAEADRVSIEAIVKNLLS